MLAKIIVNVTPDTGLLLFADVEEFVLQRLAIRQITDDAGKDATAAGEHGLTDREVDGKDAAILAHGQHLAADADDAPLSCAHVVFHIAIMAGAKGLRHEHHDVFPHHLAQRVAKEAYSGGVGRLDDAFFVDGNDGIHRRLHDGGGTLLADLQRRLQFGNAGSVR